MTRAASCRRRGREEHRRRGDVRHATSTIPRWSARELLRLSERVAARLRAQALVGRTVALKVRFADFTTITRSRTLTAPTDVARERLRTRRVELFDALGLDRARVRLVGVRVEGLVDRPGVGAASSTLGEPEQGWREAEQAVDRATARFGPGALRAGAAAGPGGRPACHVASAGGPAQ